MIRDDKAITCNPLMRALVLIVLFVYLSIKQFVWAETPRSISCSVSEGFVLLNAHPAQHAEEIKKILSACDQQQNASIDLCLLHGGFERALKNYSKAEVWYKQCVQKAPAGNLNPMFELAVTYEWDQHPEQAAQLYDQILKHTPDNRLALLGKARTLMAISNWPAAKLIYRKLLKQNPNDVDALNGAAMESLGEHHLSESYSFLNQSSKIRPNNPDASMIRQLLRDASLNQNQMTDAKSGSCPYDEGLKLVNQPHLQVGKIEKILRQCDKTDPHLERVALLHGLFERKLNHYEKAIQWLKRAVSAASMATKGNDLLELAVTYEWNEQPEQANAIYAYLLSHHLNVRDALLGQARVLRAQFKLTEAANIYRHLLQKNPHDVQALNGLGWIYLTHYKIDDARQTFDLAKRLSPTDQESHQGLDSSNNQYKYMVEWLGGYYRSNKRDSIGNSLSITDHLDAFYTLTLTGTYNSHEILADYIYLPTLLPKYGFEVNLQESTPNKYGWGVAYEYMGYTRFSAQNMLTVNGNLWLFPFLNLSAGAQDGFPLPWDNEMYYGVANLHTDYPVDFSFTTYYGDQNLTEFQRRNILYLAPTAAQKMIPLNKNIRTIAYSFDLTKEFPSRAFYDVGTSYSPSIPTWEVHGRFVYPIFENQAIDVIYSYYLFNQSVFLNLGWRYYV